MLDYLNTAARNDRRPPERDGLMFRCAHAMLFLAAVAFVLAVAYLLS